MPTISAHEQPISRIFSSDYIFCIPGYQRPYAWTTEQARDLLDDLSSFVEAHPGEADASPPYFLGSIVLIKQDHIPEADIVDGQQRLTTRTILLSAIRATLTVEHAANITPLIHERGNRILGTQDKFRLSLRERDREFFQRYVQQEGGFVDLLALNSNLSDSQQNIHDNAQHFFARLQPLPEPERLKLAQFLVTRCFLVVVTTPDLNSAYRIFSVLNSRGLDLSATDILKADITGGITDGQRDRYTQKWEGIEEDLGRDSFGDLFSHIRMIYRKAKPQGTLLKEFKDHVTNGVPPAQFIDDILTPMAKAYEEITDAEYTSRERAEPVNAALRWLNRFEFTDWMPPALAFAFRWRNDAARMEEFLCDLERLAFWMLITRSGINERIERFSRITKSIEDRDNLSIGDSPLQLTPIEQHRAYEVLNGPVYESLSARARSTVLLRLDALLAAGGAHYDYPTITVEHVLPQNPSAGSQWTKWFSEPASHVVRVHQLGNLALLTRKKNSSASNYDFAEKKAAYFTRDGVSPFALTTQVLQHAEWTPEVVDARQTELIEKLEKHWRLEERKSALDGLIAS